ncbi:hypothetical protein HMPREF9441_02281 [Paraprevotella clara YIT 11840]|uniref:Uncharacterized protein n=2 Tax=Paraprevotella clara TaxID=454154 RepID=G5SSD1_9BACT|nr:hypothetical protein HMPREF9441_02281 [Paraprevotella clara YIT 11840]
MKKFTNMIRVFLLCLCLSVFKAYGQDVRILKSVPLPEGDTVVWGRDSLWGNYVYFQKEYERYVEFFHYRDTAKTDDESVWLMYQSLRKPGLREVQKKLGDLLIGCMATMAAPDTIEIQNVSFMLDKEGRIAVVGRMYVSDNPKMLKMPVEVFSAISRRMKTEIKYPSLPGKDYYPWGISIELIDVNIGHYTFPWISDISATVY